MDVVLTAVLAVLVAAFVAAPLRRHGDAEVAARRTGGGLEQQKDRLLADLYDLEEALHAGRLSREDYAAARNDLEEGLAAVLEELDAAGAGGREAEPRTAGDVA